MAKRVASKAQVKAREERSEKRMLSSTSKAARKLRKRVIEEDFGHVPIR